VPIVPLRRANDAERLSAGLPPSGWWDLRRSTAEGLPIGMQISGPPGGEATVLRLAHAYEQDTEWHTRKP